MNAPVYDTTYYTPGAYRETVQTQDFYNEDEAVAAVEKAGEGRVVKFVRQPGTHDRSVWMKVYENGAWRDCSIHG